MNHTEKATAQSKLNCLSNIKHNIVEVQSMCKFLLNEIIFIII